MYQQLVVRQRVKVLPAKREWKGIRSGHRIWLKARNIAHFIKTHEPPKFMLLPKVSAN